MKFIFTLLIVTITMSCSAQSSDAVEDAELDCTNINTSAQVDDCVHKEMLISDSLLKKSLKNFEKRTEAVYEADPVLSAQIISLFDKAQHSWVNFRDYTCKIKAFEIIEGTPAYITTINGCLIDMNNKRVNELTLLLQ